MAGRKTPRRYKLKRERSLVWGDLWMFPYALILYQLVKRNFRGRELRVIKDEWYWADVRLAQLGYFVVDVTYHDSKN